ncbi:hypothetical protein [Thauera sp.]|uniref:hypothetical protein n=1 Tax=Thauera sp. TaxID=1905334 RepID=UPI0039E53680
MGGTAWEERHVTDAHNLGDISGAVTIGLDDGAVQLGRVVENVTFTLPAVEAGLSEFLTLILDNDESGGRAITVSGAQWMHGAAPEFDDAPNARNVLVCRGVGLVWICDGGPAG